MQLYRCSIGRSNPNPLYTRVTFEALIVTVKQRTVQLRTVRRNFPERVDDTAESNDDYISLYGTAELTSVHVINAVYSKVIKIIVSQSFFLGIQS